MKQAKVLSAAELKRVFAICATMQNGKRNRLMLLLSHYAGLRVGEIASLKWSDVLDRDMEPRTMFYLKAENTKAKEARQVHLNAKLQKELAIYWAQLNRFKRIENPVIRSQKGKHFTANSMVQAFSRVFDAAGIDDASSHSGRRWFITKMAHAGVSPKTMSQEPLLHALRMMAAGGKFVPTDVLKEVESFEDRWGSLTSTETQVAKLVSDGLTDKEIAAQLKIAPKTVENHVRAILRKADVENRTKFAVMFRGAINA